MKYPRFTILIVLLALLFVASTATAGDAPFFFVQISDPQLGFASKGTDLTPEIEHLTQAIQAVNRLKPAFVIITGDTVNEPHDPTQIRVFWRLAHEISPDIPLHIVPGNHDVAAGTSADIKSYHKLYGDDHYAFSHNGSRFIVLNSGLFGKSASQALRDEQRKWFESELAAARAGNAANIFVCGHHPWFLKRPDEADAYQNVPLAYRGDYLRLMKNSGVKYALAGHLHYDLVAKDGDLTIVAGGPISKAAAKKPQIVGLRIWKVYKDRVETQFYPLDRLPANVKL